MEYPKPSSSGSESSRSSSSPSTPAVKKEASPKAGGRGNGGGGTNGTADDDADGDDGGGGRGGNKGGVKPVYYGVDEARKRVALKCTSCGLQGALIGCHVSSCQTNTHYACAMREGWQFGEQPDADGKVRACVCVVF